MVIGRDRRKRIEELVHQCSTLLYQSHIASVPNFILLRRPCLVVSIMHRSGVRPSVCLSHLFSNVNRRAARVLNVTHQRAARDAASVHFRPSIRREDGYTWTIQH